MVITYHRQCIMPQRSFGIALMLGHISYYAWQITIFTYPLTVDIMVTSTSFSKSFFAAIPFILSATNATLELWIGCRNFFLNRLLKKIHRGPPSYRQVVFNMIVCTFKFCGLFPHSCTKENFNQENFHCSPQSWLSPLLLFVAFHKNNIFAPT